MSLWSSEELQSALSGRWVVEPSADMIPFSGVSIDTRSIVTDQFFFAFVGESVNGHDYLRVAADKGSSLCIVTDADSVPDEFAVPVLCVDDPLKAITTLASVWREKLSSAKIKVIAITGSNGKTTTCRLLAGVLEQAGNVSVSQKSFNNQLGVPITVLNTPMDADFLIAELGTSSPGEILDRATLVKPDIAGITSIGRAHLQELIDQQGVADEKTQIFSPMTTNGVAVIPGGIETLENAINQHPINPRIIRVGTGCSIKIINVGSSHTDFSLDDIEFSVPMLGDHNASNASITIVIGRELGLSDQQIRQGLMSSKLPEMRFARTTIGTDDQQIVVFNDAYNANPDSTNAAIQTFHQLQTDGPKVVVLGDMLELGSIADSEHASMIESLGEYSTIDRFIVVGNHYSRAARHGSSVPIDSFDTTTSQTIQTIAATIQPGSTLLLKGSRGIQLERIVVAIQQIH